MANWIYAAVAVILTTIRAASGIEVRWENPGIVNYTLRSRETLTCSVLFTDECSIINIQRNSSGSIQDISFNHVLENGRDISSRRYLAEYHYAAETRTATLNFTLKAIRPTDAGHYFCIVDGLRTKTATLQLNVYVAEPTAKPQGTSHGNGVAVGAGVGTTVGIIAIAAAAVVAFLYIRRRNNPAATTSFENHIYGNVQY